METPGERLRYYIEQARLETITYYATKIIGMTEANTINSYCKGKPINQRTLKTIINEDPVFPAEWILNGIGDAPVIGSIKGKKESNSELCKEKDKLIESLQAHIIRQDDWIKRLEKINEELNKELNVKKR